jgi:hypothetical protein
LTRGKRMKTLPPDLARRLLFILHRGLVEARNLALAQGNEQIAELADALEIVPSLMDHWEDDHLELVRNVLATYQQKYPGGGYDYLGHLERYSPPDRF